MKEPLKITHGKRIRYDGPDREWLMYQYHILDKSTVDIQREFGVSRTAQKEWMRRLNIPVKPRAELNKRHSKRMSGEGNPAWNGGTATNYQKRMLENHKPKVCEWCSTKKRVQLHHIDHNPENGSLDNLMWLCNHCNVTESRLYALEASGRAKVIQEDNRLIIEFRRVIP